jgi:hypothetical protein
MEVEDCDWSELTDAERAELRGYVGECLLADTDPRINMQQLYAADDELKRTWRIWCVATHQTCHRSLNCVTTMALRVMLMCYVMRICDVMLMCYVTRICDVMLMCYVMRICDVMLMCYVMRICDVMLMCYVMQICDVMLMEDAMLTYDVTTVLCVTLLLLKEMLAM